MFKALVLSVAFFALPEAARAEGAPPRDPYDVSNYSNSMLAGEKTEQAATDAAEDELIETDALFLISGLDYQRFMVGNRTAVYIVLRDRKPDTAYHPLCEHNVDKFEKVGLVKAKNSLDSLSETQAGTLRDLAAHCRAGTLNPRFSPAEFEKDLALEGGADHRLMVRDAVTTVARTLIGTYGVLRGYGKVPTLETIRSTSEPN